jgi:hypothetical protein
VLVPLNYRNLDDVPEFKGSNTTTEFLSKYVFDRLGSRRELANSAVPAGSSRPCASRSQSHTSPARNTRRPCGEHVVFAVPGSAACEIEPLSRPKIDNWLV